MKLHPARALLVLSLLLGLCASLPSRAVAADDDDPPGRVARLSVTQGQVSFEPSGTEEWVSAVLNRPVTTGDKLWTDKDSRAELQVGAVAIRLWNETGFSFLNLSDNMMQIRLTEGSIILDVRRLDSNDTIEVDTPNLAFTALRTGTYRIDVNEAGDTTVISVREGQGEVTGEGTAYTVHAGEQGYFTGTQSLNAETEGIPEDDAFDKWSQDREVRQEHAVARRYVSDDVVGYEDLDDYGGWRPVPDYGTVWFPHTTVVGWAPYRYGHWAWISPWGWTWVDDAPWGFAPFHYGRWVFVGGAWGWVPCPPRVVAVAYVRPVYAPALVAWVGGPHFAVGVGFGGGWGAGVNVGWFPLGPREVFVPAYPVSRTYVNNVNISNTTVNQTVINNYYNTTIVNKNVTVNNVKYVNQNVNGAVTVTSPKTFTSAQAVNRNIVAVNERDIHGAPIAAATPGFVPPRQAALGAGAPTRVVPPANVQTRQVVARTAPPPPPISFQQRQAAIEANHGRPISVNESRQLAVQQQQAHTNVAPVRVAPPATQRSMPAMGNSNRPGPLPTGNASPAQSHNAGGRPPANPPPNPTGNPATVNSTPANANANPNTNTRPTNTRAYNDRPPTSRPAETTAGRPATNPQLEQKHEQENLQLQQKQDQERQKLDQKQFQQQQKLEQQNADQQKQEQLRQKQQQQIDKMEQKHEQQQVHTQQKQQQERAHENAKPASAPAPAPKPKDDKPPHK